jgi:hypothetical protein
MNYAKLDGSFLKINLYDLIADLPAEERGRIIDALACSEEVINEVVNQILDGWTTEGSHASRGSGGNAEATYGIDGARMRIAKLSGKIAEDEIENLRKQIIRERESAQRGWDAYHEAINRGYR